MGKSGKRKPDSSEEQLRQLDRVLLRIALVLFFAAGIYEIFVSAGFSLQRLLLFCLMGVMGLLVGRTLGKFLFIGRR